VFFIRINDRNPIFGCSKVITHNDKVGIILFFLVADIFFVSLFTTLPSAFFGPFGRTII
jgi:hypothetical protein